MRTLILFFLYILATLLLIPIILVCYLIRCGEVILLLGKAAMRLGRLVLGIRLEVHGLENVNSRKPYVFMSNHLSLLDGPLLFMLIPQPLRVLLKKEVFRVPVIGQGMKLVGFIPVDRRKLKGGKKSIDRATSLIRGKGYSFLIFPEGTRSRDGKLQKFKRGGFFLALDSQVPIVPITLEGSYELMPRGAFFAKKGKIKVIVHQPLATAGHTLGDLPGFMERVRDVIQSGLESQPASN